MNTAVSSNVWYLDRESVVASLRRIAEAEFGVNFCEKESIIRHSTLKSGQKGEPRYNIRGTEYLCVRFGAVLINDQSVAVGETVRIDAGEIIQISAASDAEVLSYITPSREILVHQAHTLVNSRKQSHRVCSETLRVSIVIVAKNIERYISQSISSCINQTYPNIEIVVVDDGSLDRTFKKASSMAAFDSRIRVLSTTLGVNGARAAGLAAATGDYCLIIDGDDWLSTDAVEQLLLTAIDKRSQCVVFGFDHHSDKTRLIRDPVYPTDVLLKRPPIYYQKDDVAAFQISHLNHTIWMYFFSSSLKQHSIDALIRQPLYEDLPFFIILIEYAENPSMCNLVLYHYRRERVGQATENWSAVKGAYKRVCLEEAVRHTLKLITRDHLFYRLILMYKIYKIVEYEKNLSSHSSGPIEFQAWERHWFILMQLFDEKLADHIVDNGIKARFLECFTKGG